MPVRDVTDTKEKRGRHRPRFGTARGAPQSAQPRALGRGETRNPRANTAQFSAAGRSRSGGTHHPAAAGPARGGRARQAAARRAHRRPMAATNKSLARSNKSRTGGKATNQRGAYRQRGAISCAQCIGVYIHETLRSPSCGLARGRRVGLACRARLRIHIVLAKGRRNWLGMSLPGVRLQRRARLARSKWPVRVTR
jgi:hypothetical protein